MTGRARRIALAVTGGSLLVAVLTVIVMAAKQGWSTEGPKAEVVLDVPYGAEEGAVGMGLAGDYGPESPPACPEMFQGTQDGLVWVLDTVNSRVLAFKDSSQTQCISTATIVERPVVFGVTRGAVFVVKGPDRSQPFGAILMRYDLASREWSPVDLQLADGKRLFPESIRPIGDDDTALLVSGPLRPGDAEGSSGAVVLDQSGRVVEAVEPEVGVPTFIPGADGVARRVLVAEQKLPTHVPVTVERWDNSTRSWTESISASVPKLPELATENPLSIFRPLGVDSGGSLVATISEGRPLSPRFIRVASTGEISSALSPSELGVDPAPLSANFPAQHYQMTPDGSLLAQYATKDRYRVIRVTFD